jgi:hypothetical protein
VVLPVEKNDVLGCDCIMQGQLHQLAYFTKHQAFADQQSRHCNSRQHTGTIRASQTSEIKAWPYR